MADDSTPEMPKDLMTLAEATRHVAAERIKNGDWSGLPLPVIGLNLVLEPRYRHKHLSDFRWKECYDQDGVRYALDEEKPAEKSGYTTINSWWSARYQRTIIMLRDEQGRASARFSQENRLSFLLQTLEAASAWPIEAEKKANAKLATLIPEELFELYTLTGQFAEESSRSHLIYLFRRGRPTIVLRETEHGDLGLCALCLHPIGYYGDTWAGVMCPTDEVIAHLLMMRGSEEKFWANANQHPLHHHAAGL